MNKNNQWDRGFTQGYACAVANFIRQNGGVDTPIRETFRACFGDTTLAKLKKNGVDESDLSTLRKHWKSLK